ncbi:MAG: mannose-6-phosphate isomerase [Sphingomonadales bacterium]|nr:mannose-6-phosphate isomerase [Sphingomonadales bacterium]
MELARQMIVKPWGRCDIAPDFAVPDGQRIGEIWYDAPGADALPLLVKWLFTSEKLSVQVHPNDAQAKARGHLSGKEECWYIVGAEPGAMLGIGLKETADIDTLHRAALSGEIEALIDWRPVQAGEYYYIPAGTIHAIGQGVTLIEVQQYSDITYRLYDYGRLDNGKLRTLHLDDALAVANPEPYRDSRSGRAAIGQMLVDGPHFRMMLLDGGCLQRLSEFDGRKWIVPVKGTISHDGGDAGAGDCLLLPPDATINLSYDALILVAGVGLDPKSAAPR